MHNRIVTAVARIRAQRHAPRSVRTRVTSAACRAPIPACGSSNSTRFAVGTPEDVEADDMSFPVVCSNRMRAPPRQPLLLKSVLHIGLLQGRRTRVHPAGKELVV